MRRIMLATMVIAAMASCPEAQQPQDGDLVVSYKFGWDGTQVDPGGILVRHAATQQWSTLFQHAAPPSMPHYVGKPRMTSDNQDMVVVFNPMSGTGGNMLRVSAATGSGTTMASFRGWPTEFALDHDDSWIGGRYTSPQLQTNSLWRVHLSSPSSLRVSTLYSFVSAGNMLYDLAIDREPTTPVPGSPYVLGMHTQTPGLLHANRTGVVATLGNGGAGSILSVELNPLTGNYLVCGSAQNPRLVLKSGKLLTTLLSGMTVFDARYDQHGFAWLAASSPHRLVRIDQQGIAVQTIPVPTLNSFQELRGLEFYGSRKLVCNQQGKTVNIRLKSHRPGDANQRYAFACSFNRRPPTGQCLKFPGGEYLFLDHTDPLFMTSVLGLAPQIFQGLRGTTDASGVATAIVNIPASLPRLDITVFVAGVIVNAGGVTVTNTDWFVG